MKNDTDALNEEILVLQKKRAKEFELLKTQFHKTTESLKPINLIKSTFEAASSAPELKNNILGIAIGVSAGFLSKKLLIGSSHNPIKKLLGALIQFSVGNVVSKKAKGVKSTFQNLVQVYWPRKKEPKKKFQDVQNMDELTKLSDERKIFTN